jgi:hypothetical protein
MASQVPLSFDVTPEDWESLRWYYEDYLQFPADPVPRIAARIDARAAELGKELFRSIFDKDDPRELWAQLRGQLNSIRVEIVSAGPEGARIPWELLWDSRGPGAGRTDLRPGAPGAPRRGRGPPHGLLRLQPPDLGPRHLSTAPAGDRLRRPTPVGAELLAMPLPEPAPSHAPAQPWPAELAIGLGSATALAMDGAAVALWRRSRRDA